MGLLTYAHELVHVLNDISPLGLAALLGIICYQLISKRGVVRKVTENHLSDLPRILSALDAIKDHSASIPRVERSLDEIRDGVSWLKGRVG